MLDLSTLSEGALPRGPWDRPPSRAVGLRVAVGSEASRAGVLILGLNPFRLFDDGYRGFVEPDRRASVGEPRYRARLRGRPTPRRRADRARSRQDGVLQQREP
ncbi:MAG: hypothetical protein QM756_38805 [Polyangiaceae bacterium]